MPIRKPLSFVASSHLGWIYYLSGHNDEAIEQCRKILELDPSSFPARRYLGLAYEAKGMYPEAISEFQTGVKLSGSPLMLALLGHAYAVAGKKAEAQQVLSDLQQLPPQRYVSPYDMGIVLLALGDEDGALTQLNEAYRQRSSGLIFLREARFKGLQRAPEFHSLVEKMRFAG